MLGASELYIIVIYKMIMARKNILCVHQHPGMNSNDISDELSESNKKKTLFEQTDDII